VNDRCRILCTMATVTSAPRRSQARRRSLRVTALGIAIAISGSACSDSGVSAVSEEHGAAGLSSIVRNGTLKNPFAAQDDAEAASDDAAANAPGLRDPFAGAPSAVDAPTTPLKDPFAGASADAEPIAGSAKRAQERGESSDLKDPFAPAPTPAASPAAVDTHVPVVIDPFAPGSAVKDTEVMPRSTSPTDVDGSAATLQDPFAP